MLTAALGAFLVLFSDQILKRLNSNTMSGRELIWNEVQGYIARYPRLGIGLGHQMDILSANATVMTHTVAAHNEYLRFTVELGYVSPANDWQQLPNYIGSLELQSPVQRSPGNAIRLSSILEMSDP